MLGINGINIHPHPLPESLSLLTLADKIPITNAIARILPIIKDIILSFSIKNATTPPTKKRLTKYPSQNSPLRDVPPKSKILLQKGPFISSLVETT